MHQKTLHYLSILVISIALLGFVYVAIKAFNVASNHHTGTEDGTYVNTVTVTLELTKLTLEITSHCTSQECRVQKVLDFVTQIPYLVNDYETLTPKITLRNNAGDCDDKSNLLISMLHILGIESYMVLVPNHIFVVSRFDDNSFTNEKGLYINGVKYMILESTATNSTIGFPISYRLDEIEAIIEPFTNEKIEIESLEYKK